MIPTTAASNWLEWAADLSPLPDFLLKATVILLLGWVGAIALRGRNPHWRVLLWRCIAVAIVCLPAVSALAPRVSLVVAEGTASNAPQISQVVAPAVDMPQSQRPVAPMPPLPVPWDRFPPMRSGPFPNVPLIIRTPLAPEALTQSIHVPHLGTVEQGDYRFLIWIWGIGALLLFTRTILSHRRVRAFIRESQPAPLEAVVLVEQVARDLKIRARVEVRTSCKLQTPFLAGMHRPVLLLPVEMAGPDYAADLPAVAAHELSHLRSNDLAWGWLLHLMEIALWPHPLMWRVRKSHMAACEEVCDAAAARYVGSMEDYSSVLARVAYALHSSPPAACGIAMARVSTVARRLAALKRLVQARPLSGRKIAAALAISISSLFLIAALDFVRTQPAVESPNAEASASEPKAPFQQPKPEAEPEKQQVSKAPPKMRVYVIDKISRAVIPNASLEMKVNVNGKSTNYTGFKTGPVGDATLVSTATNPAYFGVIVSVPGYVPMGGIWYRESDPNIASIPDPVLVELERGTSMGGLVTDEAGNPVAGADVKVMIHSRIDLRTDRQRTVRYWPRGMHVTTDLEGRWTYATVPQSPEADGMRFWFSHPEFVMETIWFPWGSPEISRLQKGSWIVTLKKGAAISGRVVDEIGQPIEGATARIGRYSDAKETKTDVEGIFVLDQVPERSMTLVVTKEGYAPVAVQASPGRKEPKLQVELKHGMPLRGRVVDEGGNAIEGARVWLDGLIFSPLEEMLDNWNDETDRNGRFEWVDAPSQTLHISVSKNEYQDVRQIPLAPGEDEHLITLRPGIKVTGGVYDGTTMEPVEEFELIPGIQSREDSRKIAWQESPTHVKRFRDGSYEYPITWSYPGIALKVRAKGYLPAEAGVFPRDAPRKIHHDFYLVKGTGPTGQVLDPDGKPLSGASVVLCTAKTRGEIRNGLDTSWSPAYPVTTDQEGRFEFGEPAADFIIYCVHNKGFATVPVEEFTLGGTIEIKPWGRVEGQVFIGSDPAPSQSVGLVYPLEDRRDGERFELRYETTSDSEGRFAFDYAFPGNPRVARRVILRGIGAMVDGPYTHFTSVEIRPGETSTVTIGGTGRPVIGKLQSSSSSESTGRVQWDLAMGSLSQPHPPVQKGFLASLLGIRSSLERKISKERNFYFRYRIGVKADGAFCFEDIPEGNYNLDFRILTDQLRGNHVGIYESSFTVPPMPGGRSDEPLDLGVLEVTAFGE